MKDLESLVIAARQGDLAAYGRIVRQFQDMAYGYAYAILGDLHLAEDAAQEAFAEAYRNLGKLREPGAFPGWFKRIVRYRCSRLMRGGRLPMVPLDEATGVASSAPGPARAAEDREMKNKVLDAVKSLSDAQREVTTLFYINGYSQDEIADFLEVPVGTVKSRLHASRERLKERMVSMVKQALDEHRLPDDFAGKVVEGVPVLAWDRTGNTTYVAAVSAAFAVSDHQFGYDQLMVYSGLAFRLRYVRQKDGRDWCTVGPVGQFEEEVDAVCKATGCRQTWATSGDHKEMKRRTVEAIDSGNCPTAYIQGDTGVIYGYEDDGNVIFVRCYDLGEGFHRMEFEEILGEGGSPHGPFFMDAETDPMPPRDALIQGLRMGVMNWHRGRQPGEDWQPWREKGKWEFCFGDAAYGLWLEDVKSFDSLAPEEQKSLYRNHTWAAYVLYDARLSAGRFLAANADLLGEAARPHMTSAARHYEALGQLVEGLRDSGDAFVGPVSDRPCDASEWAPEARQREAKALAEAHRLDSAAMAEIEAALAALK